VRCEMHTRRRRLTLQSRGGQLFHLFLDKPGGIYFTGDSGQHARSGEAQPDAAARTAWREGKPVGG
jgi:hypothetical protein